MHDLAWCGAATFEHGDVVREIHEDYIRAGADIIIPNTFGAARHVLEPAGFGDQVEKANRKAVSLALEARETAGNGRPIAVAGSISHFVVDEVDPYTAEIKDTKNWRDPEVMEATFTEQAGYLKDAGCDLIVLEMLQNPAHHLPAVKAAVASGLPVWLGMSCGHREVDGGLPTFNHPEIDFGAAIDALLIDGVDMMLAMHCEVEDASDGLDEIKTRWSGRLGAYPHSGTYIRPHWQFDTIIGPEDYLAAAKGWVAKGCRVVGGCCGIGPDHIRLLKEALPARPGPA